MPILKRYALVLGLAGPACLLTQCVAAIPDPTEKSASDISLETGITGTISKGESHERTIDLSQGSDVQVRLDYETPPDVDMAYGPDDLYHDRLEARLVSPGGHVYDWLDTNGGEGTVLSLPESGTYTVTVYYKGGYEPVCSQDHYDDCRRRAAPDTMRYSLRVDCLSESCVPDRTPAGCILPERSLVITDPSVVDDPVRTAPDGAWHLRTIVRRAIGPDGDPDVAFSGPFARDRDDLRTTDRVAAYWPRRTASLDEPAAVVDLQRAPVVLTAIVNRIDLPTAEDHAQPQVRFVFAEIPSGERPRQFGAGSPDPRAEHKWVTFHPTTAFIFEWTLPTSRTREQWAIAWHELDDLTPGSEEYNATLQGITDAVTADYRNLASLRVSDPYQAGEADASSDAVLSSPAGWTGDYGVDRLEMTAWQWDDYAFRRMGLTNTPPRSLNHYAPVAVLDHGSPYGSAAPQLADNPLLTLIVDREQELLDGTFVEERGTANVDHAFFHGRWLTNRLWGEWRCPRFEGWSGSPPGESRWSFPRWERARRAWAITTCSGCHSEDTMTPLYHISPRARGGASQLSPFLRGVEISRRTAYLHSLVCRDE